MKCNTNISLPIDCGNQLPLIIDKCIIKKDKLFINKVYFGKIISMTANEVTAKCDNDNIYQIGHIITIAFKH